MVPDRKDMKRSSQLWFFVPHAVSGGCFIAAFIWMLIVGTNRSDPDLYLAIAGFVALVAALISSISGIFIGFRQGGRRFWPWLLAHVGGLVIALALASSWMGAHIA